jgi:hypothetical protein
LHNYWYVNGVPRLRNEPDSVNSVAVVVQDVLPPVQLHEDWPRGAVNKLPVADDEVEHGKVPIPTSRPLWRPWQADSLRIFSRKCGVKVIDAKRLYAITTNKGEVQ